jgi:hypothetical protein
MLMLVNERQKIYELGRTALTRLGHLLGLCLLLLTE